MFTFHRREIALCGRSGLGKTTLTVKLIEILSRDLTLGYAKHSGHRFDIDRPGKDTDRARHAGAAQVSIISEQQTAGHGSAPLDFIHQRTQFSATDLVLAEGWKSGPMPRMVMVADDAEAQTYLAEGGKGLGEILCWITPERGVPIHDHHTVFARDDAQAISAFIRKRFESEIANTPLYGLVLAGGRSTRMKSDKASLPFNGKTQLENTYSLLRPLCAETFVSARREQHQAAAFSGYATITDRFMDLGPMAGILSAMTEHPTAAWYIVACDLPFLDSATLQHVISERHPYKLATAYISAYDGLPEPLCAIYEPAVHERLWQFVSLRITCPRKVLINSRVNLISLQNPHALDNVNHPEEYEAALSSLTATRQHEKH